nr:unnamed protein product [Digitaria exilis]
MATTDDFPTVPAFIFLVVACALQSLWAVSVALLDFYALVAKFPLGNHWAAHVCTIGDVIVAALTFCAASASAGYVLVVRADARVCATMENCSRFEAATGMAFISFFTFLPSLGLNWLKLHVLVAHV